MRNTVFMVNMCFSGEYFQGDLSNALNTGIDELMIIKKWKKGATTGEYSTVLSPVRLSMNCPQR